MTFQYNQLLLLCIQLYENLIKFDINQFNEGFYALVLLIHIYVGRIFNSYFFKNTINFLSVLIVYRNIFLQRGRFAFQQLERVSANPANYLLIHH